MSAANEVTAVVLALGQGTELGPLTVNRAPAAVPFGGLYRTIDFALTNCLHSGIRRMLVLTQFKSHSLNKHLRDGWSVFNPEINEFVTPIAPQLQVGRFGYESATDALRQNAYLIERARGDQIVIASGEYVYRMDYAAMIDYHRRHEAGLTVACLPTGDPQRDPDLPVLGVNNDDDLISFHSASVAAEMQSHAPSMGIYVVNKSVLLRVLRDAIAIGSSMLDVGEVLIPELIGRTRVKIYRFGGTSGRVSQDKFWKRLQSLDIYYQANMELLQYEPPLDLYQDDWPIRTYQPQRPPARTVPGKSCNEGIFVNSIVAGGSVIAGGGVSHSILFPHVRVEDAATVDAAILFPGVRVGEGAQLRRCIIDKDVRIPDGTRIGIDADIDRQCFTVTDNGIVVVPKGFDFERPASARKKLKALN